MSAGVVQGSPAVQRDAISSQNRSEESKTGPKNQGRSYAARDRCSACQGAGKTQKFVPVRSSFGESRLCLFSLLELSSSPSQCLLRLFLVQLLYPSSQNCCVARKA